MREQVKFERFRSQKFRSHTRMDISFHLFLQEQEVPKEDLNLIIPDSVPELYSKMSISYLCMLYLLVLKMSN